MGTCPKIKKKEKIRFLVFISLERNPANINPINPAALLPRHVCVSQGIFLNKHQLINTPTGIAAHQMAEQMTGMSHRKAFHHREKHIAAYAP